jgi:ABC-type lipoprotein release transport system permease subunit
MKESFLYGLRAAARRRRRVVLPALTIGAGAVLTVLVLSLLPEVRRHARQFGDPEDLARTTVVVTITVLLVGVLEVAIVATRSVVQRRTEIGILLAAGVSPSSIVIALLVEPVAAACVGSTFGAMMGLAGAGVMSTTGVLNIPVSPMALFGAAAFTVGASTAASAIASALPIVRAVHRPPAATLARLN